MTTPSCADCQLRNIKRNSKHRRGFTLTEIAIVLGIIGLILGAIWTAAAAVYSNQRVNHADTAIIQLVQGIRGLYGAAGTVNGLTQAGLIAAGAVPTDLVSGVSTLSSPFPAGSTTVVPLGDNSGFLITMSGLTQSNCIRLLMDIAGTSRDPGLFLATSAAGAAATPSTAGAALTVVATPALASAASANGFGGCSSTAASATVSFAFAK